MDEGSNMVSQFNFVSRLKRNHNKVNQDICGSFTKNGF